MRSPDKTEEVSARRANSRISRAAAGSGLLWKLTYSCEGLDAFRGVGSWFEIVGGVEPPSTRTTLNTTKKKLKLPHMRLGSADLQFPCDDDEIINKLPVLFCPGVCIRCSKYR